MGRKVFTWIALLAMLFTGDASALSSLELPASITAIEEEAFMGVNIVDMVFIPDGLVSIGDRAFKNMSWLQYIRIPDSVTNIGRDILDGAMDAVLISCAPGSTAMRYAMANDIDYDANTVFHALLIGNEYPDTENALSGPYNDVDGLFETLLRHDAVYYDNIFCCYEYTYDEIDEEIEYVFGDAQDQDVSLFYFSGHGGEGGTLLTSDGYDYSAEHLREMLDGIRGRKIVIIDSCFSGAMIWDEDSALMAPGMAGEYAKSQLKAFQNDFIAAFKPKQGHSTSKAAFNPSEYFVLTASAYDQTSNSVTEYFDEDDPFSYGLFTYNLCKSCGYDYKIGEPIEMEGDFDGDNAVSIMEALISTDEAIELDSLENESDEDRQVVQAYPENCWWFAPFRRIFWDE